MNIDGGLDVYPGGLTEGGDPALFKVDLQSLSIPGILEFDHNFSLLFKSGHPPDRMLLEDIKDLLVLELLQELATLYTNHGLLVHFHDLDQALLLEGRLCWPLEPLFDQPDLCIVERGDGAVLVVDAESLYVVGAFELYEGLFVSAVDMNSFDCELLEGCAELGLVEIFGEGFHGDGTLSHKILYKVEFIF